MLFNHTNHLLKHCLFFNRGLQRIKRFLNHFLSYCKFFVCRQLWISSRIRNSGSRNNSVCTYCFRNWNNRTNMCRWDSKTLQCLRHRCTATSTGSSVGSQDSHDTRSFSYQPQFTLQISWHYPLLLYFLLSNTICQILRRFRLLFQ